MITINHPGVLAIIRTLQTENPMFLLREYDLNKQQLTLSTYYNENFTFDFIITDEFASMIEDLSYQISLTQHYGYNPILHEIEKEIVKTMCSKIGMDIEEFNKLVESVVLSNGEDQIKAYNELITKTTFMS